MQWECKGEGWKVIGRIGFFWFTWRIKVKGVVVG